MAIEPAPFIRQRGAETAHGVEKRSKPFHASVESDPRCHRNSHHPRESIRRTQQARQAKMRTAVIPPHDLQTSADMILSSGANHHYESVR
jgi:hypothetical protein